MGKASEMLEHHTGKVREITVQWFKIYQHAFHSWTGCVYARNWSNMLRIISKKRLNSVLVTSHMLIKYTEKSNTERVCFGSQYVGTVCPSKEVTQATVLLQLRSSTGQAQKFSPFCEVQDSSSWSGPADVRVGVPDSMT